MMFVGIIQEFLHKLMFEDRGSVQMLVIARRREKHTVKPRTAVLRPHKTLEGYIRNRI